jgi:uncharacterized protein
VTGKAQVPAVEGWFSADTGDPHLLGGRCTTCGTYVFPRRALACPNPDCAGREFDEVALGRRGSLWSYTENRYQPPPPYVAADPFVPFAIAAVELAEEKMVVLGQVVAGVGVDHLHTGMEMELVLDTLYEDDDNEYVVWKWAPVTGVGA